MPRDLDSVRSLFDRWSETYDADLATASGPLEGYSRSLNVMPRIVEVTDNTDLLDVGIGTGTLAAMFAARGARIRGVDPSEGMLERCYANHNQSRFASGAFTNIPFPDGEFDVVVSSFTLHEVAPSTRAAACVEVERVLRPGGQLALLDIMFPSPSAVDDARNAIGSSWDCDEDYPLVADLDTLLRLNGFNLLPITG